MNTPVKLTSDPGLHAVQEFRKAWEAGEFGYGSTIPKDWLETAMGLSDDGIVTPSDTAAFRGQWMRAVGTFRAVLLNDMKVLMVNGAEPGGYYLVRPEEQTAFAVQEFVHAVNRASRKSSEIADNTNLDVMSAEQRREVADQRALLRRMQNAVGGIVNHDAPVQAISGD